MLNSKFYSPTSLSVAICLLLLINLESRPARAQQSNESVLYSFTGSSGDGEYPLAGMIIDASGNLYGTTEFGGTFSNCPGGPSCGTVFELVNSFGSYSEKILYSFCTQANCADGAFPESGLIMDSAGNLYGTTSGGGAYCSGDIPIGCGTVFELVNSSGRYSERVLYSFSGSGGDGVAPLAGLIMDTSGSLYGTTIYGGTGGFGTVFELVNSSGTYSERVLYSFPYSFSSGTGPDGSYPYAGLIMDASGNLYGTTAAGGASSNCLGGCGTVFELINSSGSYSEKVLYSFTGPPDATGSVAGLIMDASGNLYGTGGGGVNGYGTVFELINSSGTYSEKILYSFTGSGEDGEYPDAGLIMDSSGSLYGTTHYGGSSSNCNLGSLHGCGIVFELTNSSGTYSENVLYSFTGYPEDGGWPYASLVMDTSGNLYGSTFLGGTSSNCTYSGVLGCGTVFELTTGSPAVTLSSTKLSFSDQAIDTTSVAKTVTLTNTGTATLDITSISITAGTSVYAISNDACGSTLKASKKCTIKVTFSPTALGAATGTLTFTDNATGSPQTVSLSGTGVVQAKLTPATYTFPKTTVGTTSAAHTFTLKNNLPTMLTGISFSTAAPFAVSTSTCGTTLDTKKSCTISVTFSPTATGKATGTLTVDDSANDSPQTASLSGTGD